MINIFAIIKKYPLFYTAYRIYEKLWEKLITSLSIVLFRFQCFMTGCKCGKKVAVYGRVILRSIFGGIEIGDNVTLISSSWRCSAGALNHPVRLRTFSKDAKIILESGCSLNGTSITCRSTIVRIGSGTMISPNVTIMDSDFHIPWPPEKRMQYDGTQHDSQVNIGKRVWIGANTIILKGVAIGDNSIIGAGSVVVKDISDNVLAVGNPARVIKKYDI